MKTCEGENSRSVGQSSVQMEAADTHRQRKGGERERESERDRKRERVRVLKASNRDSLMEMNKWRV